MAEMSDHHDTHEPVRPLAKRLELAFDAPVRIEVGGRRFITIREMLTEEEEARHFQIPILQDWVEKKRCLEAMQMDITAEQHDDNPFSWHEHVVLPAGAAIEYYPSWGTKKVYICSRGTFQHRGRSELCGRRCETARARIVIVLKRNSAWPGAGILVWPGCQCSF
ncbi:hypothetical protein QBC43DRAFT_332223 [Cladorrhinum sp. PSN259]|nr:hypothetical protein QBC43DRAFT_332223 [Cladorrhinum sp. PSN259]